MNTTEFGGLVTRLAPAADLRLRKTFPRLRREDREDTIQDALITLGNAVEQGTTTDPKGLFWLILERKALNRVKYNERRNEMETAAGGTDDLAEIEMGSFGVPVAHTGERVFSSDTFDRAVRELPPILREAYILVDLRGCTTSEAGRILGGRVPFAQQTISGRVKRARQALGKEL